MTAGSASDAPIVVIGGALVDVRAAAASSGGRGESILGTARISPGGAARNVAADLAAFGWRVTLLTAVGDDGLGRWVLDETRSAGVDTTHAVRLGARTGMFVSVSPDGLEPWRVSDAGVIEALTHEHIAAWAPVITGAALVASDANLSETAQRAVKDAAGPAARVLLMTSPAKAERLRAVVGGAAAVVGSLGEGRALCAGLGSPAHGVGDFTASAERNGADWRRIGAALVRAGAERAVVTLGPLGIGLVTSEGGYHVDASRAPVVDTLGAGDAVAAAIIHGLLTGVPPGGMLTFAARAAAHVAQSPDVTPSSLRELAVS
jgi:pseudouridine kinase